MTTPFTDEEMIVGINNTILANHLDACFIRPLLFFGSHSLGVHPPDRPVDVVIDTCHIARGKLLG